MRVLIVVFVLFTLLAACSAPAEPVEVTREVTRVVEVAGPTAVPVEITRLVEVTRDVPVTVEVTRVVKERFEVDEDGYIFVAGDIDFSIVAIRGDTNQSLAVGGLFPLEVGYTSSIKTMMYLCPTMGRLARWPYGSSSIYLLYRVA